jgi:hypothetical protein
MEKFVHQFLKVLADEPKKTEIYFGNDVNAALVVDHHIRVGDSEHIGTALAVRGLGFGFYPDAHNSLCPVTFQRMFHGLSLQITVDRFEHEADERSHRRHIFLTCYSKFKVIELSC